MSVVPGIRLERILRANLALRGYKPRVLPLDEPGTTGNHMFIVSIVLCPGCETCTRTALGNELLRFAGLLTSPNPGHSTINTMSSQIKHTTNIRDDVPWGALPLCYAPYAIQGYRRLNSYFTEEIRTPHLLGIDHQAYCVTIYSIPIIMKTMPHTIRHLDKFTISTRFKTKVRVVTSQPRG